eukprot:3501546-Prymnesium_polylepis.1
MARRGDVARRGDMARRGDGHLLDEEVVLVAAQQARRALGELGVLRDRLGCLAVVPHELCTCATRRARAGNGASARSSSRPSLWRARSAHRHVATRHVYARCVMCNKPHENAARDNARRTASESVASVSVASVSVPPRGHAGPP